MKFRHASHARKLSFASIAFGLCVLGAITVGCRAARPNGASGAYGPYGTSGSGPDAVTSTEPVDEIARASDTEPTPSWVGRPLSWEKLGAIERWLATEPEHSESFWRVEGELQLHQGRLELARRDLGAKEGTDAAPRNAKQDPQIASRVRAARAGLERVERDVAATDGQKKRAHDLVARADRLLLDDARPVAANSLGTLGIVTRAVWGAAPARADRMEKTQGGYRRITVHHSAEEHAPDLDGSVADSAAAIRQMQKSHMESKSPRWGDIGYHFLIDPAGHVFQGRDLVWQGAHAEGDNNVQNVGICLIGNFDEEHPTKAALDSLKKLVDGLRKQYSIARSAVYGHQDLKSTRCPGRFLEPWVKSYAR